MHTLPHYYDKAFANRSFRILTFVSQSMPVKYLKSTASNRRFR